MRPRTIFGILLILIALVAFGPALIAVGSQQVAVIIFTVRTLRARRAKVDATGAKA
jgi:hypothetical protein